MTPQTITLTDGQILEILAQAKVTEIASVPPEYDIEIARAIIAALPGWRSMDSAPKDGRTLLLGKFNSSGKWRTMRGQWFSADAIAETWEEPDDQPEGWYETSVEADDAPSCWYTEPTHWQPIPAPPSTPVEGVKP